MSQTKNLLLTITMIIGCRLAALAQEAEQPAPPAQPAAPATIEFQFQASPLQAVLEYYARLTNRSIIQAPNLAGTINFTTQTKLTTEEALQALDSVLAVNGISILKMGDKFLKVVQIPTAKTEGPPVKIGEEVPPLSDSLMTQILPLKYVEASEIAGTLQPFMHAYGQILPLTKSNSIMITDTAANIAKMLEIVKYVDQPSPLRLQSKVYVLQNAKAADVVARLQSIIQEAQQLGARPATPGAPAVPVPVRLPGQPAPSTSTGRASDESFVEGKVVLTADERTNKIFVLSRPGNFEFFEELIAELDARIEPDVVTKVIRLDFANAEEIAGQINSLITGGSFTPTRRTTAATPTTAGGRAAVPPPPTPTGIPSSPTGNTEAGGFLQYVEGVRILPDPRTNSLLVMATKQDLERLESLIRDLDRPVAQVLIEVIIGEVKLDGNVQVGVEFFRRLTENGSRLSSGGTSFGGPVPRNLTEGGITPLALASGLTYFSTFKNLDLDVVINILAGSTNFKVLSTPIIQTLHNQEGSIIVGEERPVVTSTVSDVTGNQPQDTAVRSNVEYKDVAIELRVTPLINPDGFVTLEIEQKINNVAGNIKVNGIDVPIITKREAKASVSVKDQSTIVLGGLIQEDKTITESKVALLGDIPYIGSLFKSKNTESRRNELIVFIRPTVLSGDREAMAEARRRADEFKSKTKPDMQLDMERAFRQRGIRESGSGAELPPEPAPAETPDQSKAPAQSSSAYSAKVKALKETAEKAP
jgi:general secretion pathway protein D